MTAQKPKPIDDPGPRSLRDYLSDLRVIQVVAQIAFIIIVAIAVFILASNILNGLAEKRLLPSFEAFEARAGFDIKESPEWYTTDSSYGEAIWVGITNTIRVVVLGLPLATILGIILGVFLLSNNWLIRTISRSYVELIRNTPLLLQLILLYFGILLGFPAVQDVVGLPAEGVLQIPYRFIFYVLIFLAVWYFTRHNPDQNLLLLGGAISFVVMELLFSGSGYSFGLLTQLAIIGIVAFVISWFSRGRIKPLLQGIAMLPIAQMLLNFITFMLALFNLIPDPDQLVADVAPVVIPSATGIFYPSIIATPAFGSFAAILLAGVVVAGVIWYVAGYITEASGRPIPRLRYAVIAIILFALFGWWFAGSYAPSQITVTDADGNAQVLPVEEARAQALLTPEQEIAVAPEPFIVQLPERTRFRIEGERLSLEFVALLLGLIINTAAPIGEVVRAGIQAVPHGQTEAARAVGLSGSSVFTDVVLPQALRVIIPPMGNQYLNLAKNSSLGLAVAFNDTYQVTTTVMNQSGQSVTGFAIILIFYLSMSLVISFLMNLLNSRFQLVTR